MRNDKGSAHAPGGRSGVKGLRADSGRAGGTLFCPCPPWIDAAAAEPQRGLVSASWRSCSQMFFSSDVAILPLPDAVA